MIRARTIQLIQTQKMKEPYTLITRYIYIIEFVKRMLSRSSTPRVVGDIVVGSGGVGRSSKVVAGPFTENFIVRFIALIQFN